MSAAFSFRSFRLRSCNGLTAALMASSDMVLRPLSEPAPRASASRSPGVSARPMSSSHCAIASSLAGRGVVMAAADHDAVCNGVMCR